MKKILFVLILILFTVQLVSAADFASIGMQGLSFVNPQAAQIVNGIVCISNPVLCIQQKIVGSVTSGVLQKVAEANPAAAQAISVYNQVKGYVDQGAKISEDLKVNELGKIESGKIQFNEKDQSIGNLIGKDLDQDFLIVSSVNLEKKDGLNTLTFTEDSSFLKIKDFTGKPRLFDNIVKSDEKNPAYLKLNEKGEIINADFSVNEKGGVYYFGNDRIVAPPNSKVFFDRSQHKLKINVPEGGEIKELPSNVDSKSGGNFVEISGKNIKLPGGAVLNEGTITSVVGKSYILKNSDAVINGFRVSADKTDVELRYSKDLKTPGNYVTFLDNKIYSGGDGFDIKFASDNPTSPKESLIDLKKSQNKEFFQLGDKGEDVKQIQKIVGMSGDQQDGVYGDLTDQAVKKWQAANGLKGDGLFGKASLSYAEGKPLVDFDNGVKTFKIGDKGEDVRFLQKMVGLKGDDIDGVYGSKTEQAVSDWKNKYGINEPDFGLKSLNKVNDMYGKNIILSMQGGSAVLENGKEGVVIDYKGKGELSLGAKKYSFDGDKVQRILSSQLTNLDVQTPVTLNTNTKSLISQGGSVRFGDLNNENLYGKIRPQIDPSSTSCAGTVRAVCNLQSLENAGGGFKGKISENVGVGGNAWEMQKNIIDKGGEKIWSKEDILTADQKNQLEQLKNSIKGEGSLSDESKRKELSQSLRDPEGKILNRDSFNSPIDIKEGDVVSMYYRDSSFLSTALVKGDNGQKNTHVGITIGDDVVNIPLSSGNILDNVRSKLGVSDSSLYLDKFSYTDSQGVERNAFLKGGSFVDESGSAIGSISNLKIYRPRIAHMIHYYQGESNPFHIEDLDKVISRDDISLYGVTRPAYTSYLKDYYPSRDVASASGGETILQKIGSFFRN